MFKFLLVFLVLGACKAVRTEGDTKFITVAQSDPRSFRNNKNVLVKRVHEKHWDIFYRFSKDCPAGQKTEKNYRILRQQLEKLIKVWLAPLKEITNRPIVDRFVFYKSKENNPKLPRNNQRVEYEISADFSCKTGRSLGSGSSRLVQIKRVMGDAHSMRVISPDLPYATDSLLHELGHVFHLADTYVGNIGFSPPSSGGLLETIGSQPRSVMSSVGCWNQGNQGLCLDDKRAIQWLYRYYWENLDPKKCPPEFVYEELTQTKNGLKRTVGGCVYRQPLLIELRQRHLSVVNRLLKDDKKLKINDKDKYGHTALHHVALVHLYGSKSEVRGLVEEILKYPGINVNITDKHGNAPLHWVTWFGNKELGWQMLFLDEVRGDFPERRQTRVNIRNNYGETPLHTAASLGRKVCADILLMRSDIRPNLKENRAGNTPLHEAAKNGHTEVVKLLLAHDNINRNIRNRSGKTARQLAESNGHKETVKAFD